MAERKDTIMFAESREMFIPEKAEAVARFRTIFLLSVEGNIFSSIMARINDDILYNERRYGLNVSGTTIHPTGKRLHI